MSCCLCRPRITKEQQKDLEAHKALQAEHAMMQAKVDSKQAQLTEKPTKLRNQQTTITGLRDKVKNLDIDLERLQEKVKSFNLPSRMTKSWLEAKLEKMYQNAKPSAERRHKFIFKDDHVEVVAELKQARIAIARLSKDAEKFKELQADLEAKCENLKQDYVTDTRKLVKKCKDAEKDVEDLQATVSDAGDSIRTLKNQLRRVGFCMSLSCLHACLFHFSCVCVLQAQLGIGNEPSYGNFDRFAASPSPTQQLVPHSNNFTFGTPTINQTLQTHYNQSLPVPPVPRRNFNTVQAFKAKHRSSPTPTSHSLAHFKQYMQFRAMMEQLKKS